MSLSGPAHTKKHKACVHRKDNNPGRMGSWEAHEEVREGRGGGREGGYGD